MARTALLILLVLTASGCASPQNSALSTCERNMSLLCHMANNHVLKFRPQPVGNGYRTVTIDDLREWPSGVQHEHPQSCRGLDIICPAGGTYTLRYTLSPGSVTIVCRCSVHGSLYGAEKKANEDRDSELAESTVPVKAAPSASSPVR